MELEHAQSQLVTGISECKSCIHSPFGLLISTKNAIYKSDMALVAGNKEAGYINGHATFAKMNQPHGIAVSNQTIYVCDTLNHVIRRISNGIVDTFAGTGQEGYADGPLLTAQFNKPTGIYIVKNTIYISESHRIRRIQDGIVTTVAGTEIAGFKDGMCCQAQFNSPQSLVWDDGAIYVADTNNHRIRMIRDGIVSTYAGSEPGYTNGPCSYATFIYPKGITCDMMGNLYVSDLNCIRKIDNDEVSLFSPIKATALDITHDKLLVLTSKSVETLELLLLPPIHKWNY